MSRRAVVLIMAAVIAAAVAIPALADPGPTAKSAGVRGLSKRALAKAKASLRLARGAKREARRATGTATAARIAAGAAQSAASAAGSSAAGALNAASSAGEKADGAELAAKQARAEVAATRPRAGVAEAAVSTGSEAFVALDGGPAVTVDVPASNLVQVWAQALIDGEGAVSLYEDGHPAQGQAECGTEDVLFSLEAPSEPLLVGTPATLGPFGCSTVGAPGPVLFRSDAGQHSFELRYAACACEPPADPVSFSQRRLVVAPLP